MNTNQINSLFKGNNKYLGTFPKDLLPKTNKTNYGLIVNTDNSNNPGEHWVAIYKAKDKIDNFDSFGLPPLHAEIIDYLNKSSSKGWIYNTLTFQNESSDACGMYCILFIKMRLKGYKAKEIATKFSKKTLLNDLVAKSLCNIV